MSSHFSRKLSLLTRRATHACGVLQTPHCVQENAQRLKAYKSSLVLFPRKSKKPRAGDSTGEELTNVTQVTPGSLTILKPTILISSEVGFCCDAFACAA